MGIHFVKQVAALLVQLLWFAWAGEARMGKVGGRLRIWLEAPNSLAVALFFYLLFKSIATVFF